MLFQFFSLFLKSYDLITAIQLKHFLEYFVNAFWHDIQELMLEAIIEGFSVTTIWVITIIND